MQMRMSQEIDQKNLAERRDTLMLASKKSSPSPLLKKVNRMPQNVKILANNSDLPSEF
jgi:hypothetical protein